MGTHGWVMWPHTRTHSTRWVWDFPIYIPMGNVLFHTLTLIGFLPAGYVGNGYPLPSLSKPNPCPRPRYILLQVLRIKHSNTHLAHLSALRTSMRPHFSVIPVFKGEIGAPNPYPKPNDTPRRCWPYDFDHLLPLVFVVVLMGEIRT